MSLNRKFIPQEKWDLVVSNLSSMEHLNFESPQNNNMSNPQPKMKCDTTQLLEDAATGPVNDQSQRSLWLYFTNACQK